MSTPCKNLTSLPSVPSRNGVAATQFSLPYWVPSAARMYLVHTEVGLSIRSLAREAGCHASTVMRQIRRIEMKRDDPLIDMALKSLGRKHFRFVTAHKHTLQEEANKMSIQEIVLPECDLRLESQRFAAEAARVLRRLCENGAVMAVATNMEKAVVVRDTDAGVAMRTAVVDREIAEAMALKDWISPAQSGKITRYTITVAGRSALEEMLAVAEPDAPLGFAEAQTPFAGAPGRLEHGPSNGADDDRPRRNRYNLTESPLSALARRKDKDGSPFLSAELVSAGEQLREDFELAQMGPRVAQNWDRFLTAGGRDTFVPDSGVANGPAQARQRVADALTELGSGLSDVVLRCCCYLEGLETAEKKLGWSARSGKIVLRIALVRLKRHYDLTIGPGGPLIG